MNGRKINRKYVIVVQWNVFIGYREGRNEGRDIGSEEGRNEGSDEGRHEGSDEVKYEGRDIGNEEGRNKGSDEVTCNAYILSSVL